MKYHVMIEHFAKILRYIRLYGLRRTIFKVIARSKMSLPLTLWPSAKQDIALIGCGQFGVTTLGYFLTRRFGRRLKYVFDVDSDSAHRARHVLGASRIASCAHEIFADPEVSYVYIASHHSSHADYAVAALQHGKTAFTEKPVAVTRAQLERLSDAAFRAEGRLFAGYNRPFSPAILTLKEWVGAEPMGGVSLSCFVSGHVISKEHWYRRPIEGTRISGNAGHWIDLFCHILAWRSMPEIFKIQLAQADPDEPDDNFILTIATEKKDIFVLTLTARSEPFEGINETINYQQDDVICKIDDFRKMTVWRGTRVNTWRYWPKDPGHRLAAMQPFIADHIRSWDEVEISTLLMLHVTEMVQNNVANSVFHLSNAINRRTF